MSSTVKEILLEFKDQDRYGINQEPFSIIEQNGTHKVLFTDQKVEQEVREEVSMLFNQMIRGMIENIKKEN